MPPNQTNLLSRAMTMEFAPPPTEVSQQIAAPRIEPARLLIEAELKARGY